MNTSIQIKMLSIWEAVYHATSLTKREIVEFSMSDTRDYSLQIKIVKAAMVMFLYTDFGFHVKQVTFQVNASESWVRQWAYAKPDFKNYEKVKLTLMEIQEKYRKVIAGDYLAVR